MGLGADVGLQDMRGAPCGRLRRGGERRERRGGRHLRVGFPEGDTGIPRLGARSPARKEQGQEWYLGQPAWGPCLSGTLQQNQAY